MAGKPSAKVYGKRKNNGDQALPEYIDLAAFWVNDDGKLGGMWSRDIVAIKMQGRDGKPYVVTAEQLKGYFCNLRDDREQAPTRPAPRAQARPAAKPNNDPPPDFGDAPDFGDDEIPF